MRTDIRHAFTTSGWATTVLARNRLAGEFVPPAIFIREVTRDAAGVWHATHDIEMLPA